MKAQRCEVEEHFPVMLAKLVSNALLHDDSAVIANIRGIVPEYLPQYTIDKPFLKAILAQDDISDTELPLADANGKTILRVNGKH